MQPIPRFRKGLPGVLLVLLLSLPACIFVVDADDYSDRHLYRSHWRLEVIVYYGRSYTAADAPYTLSFDSQDRITGYAACNEYDAYYDASALGTLSIRDIYSTDARCGPASLDDYFFESLASARSYRMQRDALTITDRGGDHVLYFYRD